MGNPFQDQLLKAGLVSKKQAGKVKREKHLSRKQKKNNGSSELSASVREEQAAQARRNRELNKKRNAEKLRHENRAQIRQIIAKNRLERDDRGEAYHFVEENRINRIFVDDEMAEQLSCGRLAIVKSGDGYEVVPAKAARQIAGRDRKTVVVFHVQEDHA